MPRILIAELKQETATFNPEPTTYDDFQVYGGDSILSAFAETQTELAGAFGIFADNGCEIVPTVAAAAVSGGRVRRADLERLLTEIEHSASKQHDIDAIYLCLHGAMAGEKEDDPEGRLLETLRFHFENTPLVASLDLHAVLTDRMISAADILVPYHTYPHTDHFETGQRAARNVLRLLTDDVRPAVARVQLPMLVRGDELLTAGGRFGEAIRMCQEIEARPSGLAAGVIIGNAFTDVPGLQSNVLVTVDNEIAQAKSDADRIGKFMWNHRKLFQATLASMNEALTQAVDTSGLVVFSDAADATASGASGDSNAILAALLRAKIRKKALIPIVDAPAVHAAFEAGVSTAIDVTLGGTRDPGRFAPLPVRAEVMSLHDGQFTYEDGTVARGGRVAVLRIGPITVMATERPVYVVGRRVFESHGLDPVSFDIVVVKSPNGFRTWYESIAQLIVPVDAPGSTSANLLALPFENCVRPIFPLDPETPSPFEKAPR